MLALLTLDVEDISLGYESIVQLVRIGNEQIFNQTHGRVGGIALHVLKTRNLVVDSK
jgi:hypothetical protein